VNSSLGGMNHQRLGRSRVDEMTEGIGTELHLVVLVISIINGLEMTKTVRIAAILLLSNQAELTQLSMEGDRMDTGGSGSSGHIALVFLQEGFEVSRLEL